MSYLIFLKKFEDIFFKFNIDIFLIHTIISLVYVYKITKFDINLMSSLLLLTANIAGISIIYIYNKIADSKEDKINESSIHDFANKNILDATLIILFSYAIIVYISFLNPVLIIMSCLIFILGILYSHQNYGRFKKYFLIKNILPAFFWYTSILIFITTIYEINISYAGKLILPAFFIFLLFEILWDIPDMHGDKKANIQTLPTKLGVINTKIILTVFFTLFIIMTDSLVNKITAISIILFLIYSKNNATKKTYHYFLIFLTFLIIFLNILIPYNH